VAVAGLDRGLDDALRLVLGDLEGAEAELRDRDAVVQGDVRDLCHLSFLPQGRAGRPPGDVEFAGRGTGGGGLGGDDPARVSV